MVVQEQTRFEKPTETALAVAGSAIDGLERDYGTLTSVTSDNHGGLEIRFSREDSTVTVCIDRDGGMIRNIVDKDAERWDGQS